jgi:ABC-type transport system involved in multi-copper enzyme maturation permease subunit
MISVDAIVAFESRLALRGRALLVSTLVFALTSALVAGLGIVTFRQLGLRAVTPSAIALLDLTVLVPTLVALVVGASALSAPGDAALRAMLRARGLSAAALSTAKLAAATSASWIIVVAGVGSAALVLVGTASARDLVVLSVVLAASLLACMATASAGLVVGALVRGRAEALLAGVAVWAVLALGVDLALMALAPSLRGASTPLLLAAALDPIEAARLAGLLAIGADAQVLGVTGALLRSSFGAGPSFLMLLGSELAWTIVLWRLAAALLGRRDA